MSCTVRVTTDVAGVGEVSFFSAVRFAGARLALVVAVGAVTVGVRRVAAVRRAAEPLEDLLFLEELLRFLVPPLLARCFTGVVATGVVLTGAGAGVGVAAVVVTVAEEPELLLLLYGLFFLLSVLVAARFFEPLVVGGFGTGVGAATVVTPVESV
jgi:hypothetical protein